jgi:hypothetical protein
MNGSFTHGTSALPIVETSGASLPIKRGFFFQCLPQGSAVYAPVTAKAQQKLTSQAHEAAEYGLTFGKEAGDNVRENGAIHDEFPPAGEVLELLKLRRG